MFSLLSYNNIFNFTFNYYNFFFHIIKYILESNIKFYCNIIKREDNSLKMIKKCRKNYIFQLWTSKKKVSDVCSTTVYKVFVSDTSTTQTRQYIKSVRAY